MKFIVVALCLMMSGQSWALESKINTMVDPELYAAMEKVVDTRRPTTLTAKVPSTTTTLFKGCVLVVGQDEYPIVLRTNNCQALGLALVFNKRRDFYRLYQFLAPSDISHLEEDMLNPNVRLKVLHNRAVYAQRQMGKGGIGARLKLLTESTRCERMDFFGIKTFCFNGLLSTKSYKLYKRNNLRFAIPVLTALRYGTTEPIGNELHSPGQPVVAWEFMMENNVIFTDASNPVSLGYRVDSTRPDNNDRTSCNPQLNTNYEGSANFKEVHHTEFPSAFTPNHNGKHNVAFICGHTINRGNSFGQANLESADQTDGNIQNTATIFYHEINHMGENPHPGCLNIVGEEFSRGKDRNMQQVYGTHINYLFANARNHLLSCYERTRLWSQGRMELLGNGQPNGDPVIEANKICMLDEVPSDLSFVPSHPDQDTPPVCY